MTWPHRNKQEYIPKRGPWWLIAKAPACDNDGCRFDSPRATNAGPAGLATTCFYIKPPSTHTRITRHHTHYAASYALCALQGMPHRGRQKSRRNGKKMVGKNTAAPSGAPTDNNNNNNNNNKEEEKGSSSIGRASGLGMQQTDDLQVWFPGVLLKDKLLLMYSWS